LAKPKRMRRRLFVDKFQYRIVLIHLVHFAAFIAVIFGALYLPLLTKLDDTSLSPLQKMELSNQIHAQTARLMPVLWLVFGLLIVSSAIVAHRLAGPLSRMRRALRATAEGDLSNSLSIRKNDYLVPEAEAINTLIASLNGKIRAIKKAHRRADTALKRLNDAMPGAPEDKREKLEALRVEIDAWKLALSEFKIAGEEDDREESPRPRQPSLSV
jgi:methyl-accepting chemotaxis protein